ncbi:hypothetical protein CEXT_32891 [Caerostris extrusa]|uniref:Uncharacterized protein n=1 Tax=Caerostris extrusa TaxID=172846 RepID=A0AAV4SRC4_CAEEX|nr:hypothetical protein CEXT_32891 [Caerostris extrusa]
MGSICSSQNAQSIFNFSLCVVQHARHNLINGMCNYVADITSIMYRCSETYMFDIASKKSIEVTGIAGGPSSLSISMVGHQPVGISYLATKDVTAQTVQAGQGKWE